MSAETSTAVYQYYDQAGHLLYVGITERGNARLREHAKTKSWFRYAVGCSIEHYDTREDALERESFLIRKYLPPFNSQQNPMRNRMVRTENLHAPRIGGGKASGAIHGRALREARRKWYALSLEARASALCIRCQMRPAKHGPECTSCHPSNARRAYVYAD